MTIIRVSYEVNYNRSGHEEFASYDYGTGRNWKSNIRVAAIKINGSDIAGANNFSLREAPNWRRLSAEDSLRLETTDYQPRYPSVYLIVPVAFSH